MKVGIGYSNDFNAFESGKRIAEMALHKGDIEKPDLLLAFCGGRIDAGDFFRGLKSSVGTEVPIIGGSAIGIITNDDLSYEGFPAGVAILQWDEVCQKIASVNELDLDEYRAGRKLGEELSSEVKGKLLLMFYDSIKASPTDITPPVMNASPPLVKGMEESLGASLPIVGGGLIGDYEFSPTRQFCGSSIGHQCVVGALLSGKLDPYVQIMHGCTLKDGIYHTITRIQGPVIYEINGRPVVEMLDEIYGDRGWREQRPVKRLAIGVNHGDKYGDYDEGNFVARLIAGVLPEGDGIVLFEPDLAEGTEITFMLRDGRTMIESAKHNSIEVMQRIRKDGRTPRFALYIDCAGRTASYSDTLTEEAAEIQAVLNQHNVPLLGFYSGVEVAPLLGKNRGLDWTGVLLVLAEG